MLAMKIELLIYDGDVCTMGSGIAKDYEWVYHPKNESLYLMPWPPRVSGDGAAWGYEVRIGDDSANSWLTHLKEKTWFEGDIESKLKDAITSLEVIAKSGLALSEHKAWF